ncbi:bifunctional oligoribonuclease/PAP phosphatase NrnA [Halorientalis brevis]|uniref:Bifunctional oligoribonuclease/PAP phosphatase NrnA n=1 Tax=Halorientalis brevis TaxID=1126241 RepID=A0ABD6CC87_9EURY|nr:bifunctional oligoribonuclease/PAP phosphatase NrnA [Halorientalis brevis]
MDTRLVVGCGSLGHGLVEAMAGYPGTLLVVDENERRVERLREEGVAATHVPTIDAGTLREQVDGVDTVVVADDDPSANLDAARAVSVAFPGAIVLAYAGDHPDSDVVAELRSVADDVVDSGTATTEFLMDRIGDDGLQIRQLRQVFWDIEGTLAIVTHDNPDPDAIASAVALQRIADALGVDAEICYYGRISHQENRAFINLLDLDLCRLESDVDLSEYAGFALVDHSRPGVNDQLPPDTDIDIVIDHHPPRAPVDARFVDLRSSVGATSTLLVQYLQQFGIQLDETVATALLFGIRIDTKDFSREVSIADFHAAATIVPTADIGTLERIESPSISGDTMETVASAISNRERRGAVLTSCVDGLGDRDALAQAADQLLDLDGINATVVFGVIDGVIYVSGRARGTDLDLGETLRDAFDQIGSAGGHADMAGAQIPVAETTLATDPEVPITSADGDGQATVDAVGSEESASDGESTAAVTSEPSPSTDLETFVTERFYEALRSRPRRETAGLAFTTDDSWFATR